MVADEQTDEDSIVADSVIGDLLSVVQCGRARSANLRAWARLRGDAVSVSPEGFVPAHEGVRSGP
jgi:hypothetical protein